LETYSVIIILNEDLSLGLENNIGVRALMDYYCYYDSVIEINVVELKRLVFEYVIVHDGLWKFICSNHIEKVNLKIYENAIVHAGDLGFDFGS
jgi:hypothetical protein